MNHTSPYASWNGNFTIRPANEHIGADLEGIDLAQAALSEQTMAEIRTLLSRHLVLRVRGQKLDAEQAVRITAWFGPLMDVRRPEPMAVHVPGHPEIQILSNGLDEQGRRIGDGNTSAQIWHTDAAQWEVPPGVVLFYGRQTTEPAPHTHFLNMVKVYAALPEAMKQRIRDLKVVHHMYSQSVDVAVHLNGKSLPLEQRAAGVPQPLVRRHIQTGEAILYLPTRRDSVIPGLGDDEARALLTELWDFANASAYKWMVQMGEDDVVLWDNAALVHCRDGWPEDQVRTMWHLLSEGEKPTPMYPSKTQNLNKIHQLGY